MSNWEYKVVEIKPNLVGSVKAQAIQDELGKLGKLGWELVAFTHTPMSAALAVFKKEHR
jgi:hypothetical protein